MDVCKEIVEIEDRITDQLARSVIGDIATTIDVEELRPVEFKFAFRQ